jgi:hypothetical protein
LIARRHAPLAFFAYQILLGNDLSLSLNRVDDASKEGGVYDRDIARDFDGADVHAIELIETLGALEGADESLA